DQLESARCALRKSRRSCEGMRTHAKACERMRAQQAACWQHAPCTSRPPNFDVPEEARMKRSMTAVLTAAALVSLGACKNGGNKAGDTAGMNGGAAGSVGSPSPDSTGAGAAGAGG